MPEFFHDAKKHFEATQTSEPDQQLSLQVEAYFLRAHTELVESLPLLRSGDLEAKTFELPNEDHEFVNQDMTDTQKETFVQALNTAIITTFRHRYQLNGEPERHETIDEETPESGTLYFRWLATVVESESDNSDNGTSVLQTTETVISSSDEHGKEELPTEISFRLPFNDAFFDKMLADSGSLELVSA